jgi:hypothetical protein
MQPECGRCVGSLILLNRRQIDIRVAGLRFQEQRRREEMHVIQSAILRIVLRGTEISSDIAARLDR